MKVTAQLKITIGRTAAMFGRIAKQGRSMGIPQRMINAVFRWVGTEVGAFYLDRHLPLHFHNEAYNRYGYVFRTPNWEFTKLKPYGWDAKERRWFKTHQPPTPNIWTSKMFEMVMSQRGSFTGKAIATGRKGGGYRLRVEIPIRIPHPVRPKYAGEIVRMSVPEYRWMRDEIAKRVRARFRQMKPGR